MKKSIKGKCVEWEKRKSYGVVRLDDGLRITVYFKDIKLPEELYRRLFVGEEVLVDEENQVEIVGLNEYVKRVYEMRKCLINFDIENHGENTSAYIDCAKEARGKMRLVDRARARLHTERVNEDWLVHGTRNFLGRKPLLGYDELESRFLAGPQKVLNQIELHREVQTDRDLKTIAKENKARFHYKQFLNRVRKVVNRYSVSAEVLRAKYEKLLSFEHEAHIDGKEVIKILLLMVQVCEEKAVGRKNKKEIDRLNSLRVEILQHLKILGYVLPEGQEVENEDEHFS
jgi:hypothetical protein